MIGFHARMWGIKAAMVRLFSIYGEGLKRQLLWDACRKLTGGTASFSGTGNEARDWIHVSDAASLLAEAAERASEDVPVCNGATGLGVPTRLIVEELRAALGVTAPARFDGVARAGDPACLVGSADIARGWNWTPTVAWRDGMRRYASWFRADSA
jgi:UDP-glucose 4-epimerase